MSWLREHPAEAARYEAVKVAAAGAEGARRASYNAGKTAIIQEILDRARTERGLPPAMAYDK